MSAITVRTSEELRELIIRELKDGIVISVDFSTKEEENSDGEFKEQGRIRRA